MVCVDSIDSSTFLKRAYVFDSSFLCTPFSLPNCCILSFRFPSFIISLCCCINKDLTIPKKKSTSFWWPKYSTHLRYTIFGCKQARNWFCQGDWFFQQHTNHRSNSFANGSAAPSTTATWGRKFWFFLTWFCHFNKKSISVLEKKLHCHLSTHAFRNTGLVILSHLAELGIIIFMCN